MKSKNIWIVGASYGIGKALAFELAKRGNRVIVSGRSLEQLSNICKELPLQEKDHLAIKLDVSDEFMVQSSILEVVKHLEHIDSIIFMAAFYEPSSILEMRKEDIIRTINVNLTSVLYFVQSILPILLKQKKGQIALCSSVASYRGLANSQPYAATKAAISNFTESLNSEYGDILDIKLINPGFVETRLTEKNNFAMPFKMTPTKAAKKIADGLGKKSFEIHFPKVFTLFLKFLKVMPDFLYFKISKKLK